MKNRHTFSWAHSSLFVKEIPGIGFGVYTREKIKKGEKIAVFGGYVQHLADEHTLPEPIRDNCHQISHRFMLGVKKTEEAELSSYFNHSCEPNAGWKGQIVLVAMRTIKAGEQVTFDYAMVLSRSKHSKSYRMKCLCGTKSCRGLVTESDWRRLELQEKYKGYFQWYIEEKIERSRKRKARASRREKIRLLSPEHSSENDSINLWNQLPNVGLC